MRALFVVLLPLLAALAALAAPPSVAQAPATPATPGPGPQDAPAPAPTPPATQIPAPAPTPPRPPAPPAPPPATTEPAPPAPAEPALPAAPSPPPAARPTPMLDPGPPEPAAVPPPPVLPLPPEESSIPAPAPPVLPVADPEVLLLTGPAPWIVPPLDPAPPGALPGPSGHGDDARLYRDLPWDFCGPRIGLVGVGRLPEPVADPRAPVDFTAERAEYDRVADLVRLQGGVDIVQGEQRLTAERAAYDRRTGEVAAAGDVFVAQPGARLKASSGRYNLESGEGTLHDVGYRLAGDANLRGTADRALLLPGNRTRYEDVIYTTCPPGRQDWSLRASDLLLSHTEGMGTARNARVRLAGVPVLYSPWLRFPIDDRRRSGLLIPTIGTSDRTGFDFTLPYYWNIAPNLDATFFPRWMSERGAMLGLEVRHLSRFGILELEGEVLPEDAEEPDLGTRGAGRVIQAGQLAPRWSTAVDASAVSDDRYLSDFGNRLAVTSVRNLPQRADLLYSGDGFYWLARLQQFQTVDPDIPPEATPYAQLPHMELALNEPERLGGGPLELYLEGRFDYFGHSDKVEGARLVALPSLRLPLRRSFGHFVPRTRLYYTGYELRDPAGEIPEDQSHLIPSLDLDTGLVFERDTRWLGSAALQTLEPRLYYVLTPYRDQSDTPLFDTTELDFSFASLFRPNRFTGYDRIGDENRLTVGLTSRTLAADSGRELFRFSVGQIFFFENRQVQLSGSTPQVDDSSSVAGELAASLDEDWEARASVQWNPNEEETPWEKRVLALRWAPDDARILNLAYRYNLGRTEDESYEDTDLSFALPVTRQVQVVGRWLYSLLHEETVDAFAGIEIGRCCWRVRLVGRHLKTAAEDTGSTSVMLQLELAGLGALGSSVDKLLEESIYGYSADRFRP